ncbi:MAG: NusG domain II-containing protein [Ruminococcaceae bacterium]|nr:NusG domain II-containing protein [Oscillospiraceae bacterium]
MQVFPKKKITVSDIILLIVMAASAVILFIFSLSGNAGDSFTVSTPQGEISYPLGINKTYEIESRGIILLVTVFDGRVAVTESSCPDHTCEHSGEISRDSEVIVCVPAGVVIKIISENSGQVQDEDFVIG